MPHSGLRGRRGRLPRHRATRPPHPPPAAPPSSVCSVVVWCVVGAVFSFLGEGVRSLSVSDDLTPFKSTQRPHYHIFPGDPPGYRRGGGLGCGRRGTWWAGAGAPPPSFRPARAPIMPQGRLPAAWPGWWPVRPAAGRSRAKTPVFSMFFLKIGVGNLTIVKSCLFLQLSIYKCNIMKSWSKNGENEPWWVIVLKIVAYAIGLIIGGIGTTASAQMLHIL